MYKYFFQFFLLLFLCSSFVNAQQVVKIKDNETRLNISKYVSVLETKAQKLTIEEVQKENIQHTFIQNNKDTIALKEGDNEVTWVKFTLQNHTDKDLYLEVNEPAIPYMAFYIPNKVGGYEVKTLGSSLHAHKKEFNSNTYIVQLLSANDTLPHDFYISFRNKLPHFLTLQVGTIDHFFNESHTRDVFFGLFVGIVVVMFIYNFFIYLSIRDKAYLYYILHILMTGLSSVTFDGYASNVFWADFPQINEYMYAFMINIPMCFLILFSIYFLETKKYSSTWHKGLLIMFILFLVNIIFTFTHGYIALLIGNVFILFLCIYLFILSWRIYLKGHRPARFYIMANTSYITGVFIVIFAYAGIFPANFFTTHATQVGTILEILLFSFALTDRIKTLNKEREEAQKENLKLVEEQKESLEQKVKERTKELETANHEISTQNEELIQQQEEILAVNEALEQSNRIIKYTSDRLNKSIQYANHIQQVILPKKEKINRFFEEHFAFYFPKDVVSGDFYWFTLLNEHKAVFVLADCTGHGVPGAFMSIIGNTLLHEITKTKNMHTPSEILYSLDVAVRNILKQDQSRNSDGMDISVCLFEKQADNHTYQITFSGAKSDLFYVKQNQIHKLNGDRTTIGGISHRIKTFKDEKITLHEGDLVYFSSDGYIDQNNIERKRFGSHQFKDLLLSISTLPMQDQYIKLSEALKEHQQEEEQRDDISVVGIRL